MIMIAAVTVSVGISMNRAILALAISAFGIGTTEFVIMGILPEVSHSLKVSIPQAGLLVSLYALGVAIGAPILALLTKSLSRKQALILLMLIFIIGNVCCALSYHYSFMMIARVITSFCHGAFFGIGAVVAAHLVPPERRASAVAMMFTGLTLANVIGVPFGTWVAQHWDWHLTFWLIAGIGMIALLALIAFLPSCGNCEPIHFGKEFAILKSFDVVLAMLLTVFTFASVFALFTYITPILFHITDIPKTWLSMVLLLIGLGTTIGNLWGGKLADQGIPSALFISTGLLVMVSIIFLVTSQWAYLGTLTLLLWGIASFASVPALQMNVVKVAHTAPNIASTLNIGAFNIGNGLGAYLGGVPLSLGLNARACIGVAIILALIALLLTVYANARIKRSALVSVSPLI